MPLRIRRGTDEERVNFTPLEGELVYTTDTKRVFVGDGVTEGGVPLTAEAIVDNLESNLDLNNFDIVGIGNVNITGDITASGTINGNVTGNLQGNVIGDLEGNVNGSLFADDSSILVDGLNGNHYGLFNGNLIGNVTGNVFGNVAGNVTGDVTGNVTGNLIGNVTGNLNGIVTGDLKGSIFAEDSAIMIDSLDNSVYGTFKGRILSSEKHQFINEDENDVSLKIFSKTAPSASKGVGIRLHGFKGSHDAPLQPDNFSRLSLTFAFWDNNVNNYDTKAYIGGFTQTNGAGFMYIGVKKFTGAFTDGIRIDGSDGSISLRNFGRIDLEAPTINAADLVLQSNQITNKISNQNINIISNGTGNINLDATTVNISNLTITNNEIINPTSNQNIKLVCNGTGTIELAVPTQLTVGAAGAASVLPASPDIYIQINVNGVNYVVPGFAVS